MNRRSFIASLTASGMAVSLSPLLAIPVLEAVPAPTLTRTVGPLIKIKPYDVSSQDLKGVDGGGQFTFSMKEGDKFVFQVRPSTSPKKSDKKAPKDNQRYTKAFIFSDFDVVRIVNGRPIEIDSFYFSFSISRSDINGAMTLDNLPIVIPPPEIELDWREVSYT